MEGDNAPINSLPLREQARRAAVQYARYCLSEIDTMAELGADVAPRRAYRHSLTLSETLRKYRNELATPEAGNSTELRNICLALLNNEDFHNV
jgi:hypothetical protein